MKSSSDLWPVKSQSFSYFSFLSVLSLLKSKFLSLSLTLNKVDTFYYTILSSVLISWLIRQSIILQSIILQSIIQESIIRESIFLHPKIPDFAVVEIPDFAVVKIPDFAVGDFPDWWRYSWVTSEADYNSTWSLLSLSLSWNPHSSSHNKHNSDTKIVTINSHTLTQWDSITSAES